MPIANQEVAQRVQQSQLMRLQAGVGAAPSTGAGVREIQQAGAAQAAQVGAATNQAAEKTIEQSAELGKAAVQDRATSQLIESGEARLAGAEAGAAQEDQLAQLGQDVRKQIFDDRIQFARDEAGRKLLTESQLADHAAHIAKDENEFKQKMQFAELQHTKKMQVMQMAHQKLAAALEFEYRKKAQDRSQSVVEELARAKRNIELKIQAEAAASKNRQAQWSSAGVVLGAVIGGVAAGVSTGGLGAGAGAALGASIGGAAGGAIGSTVEANRSS